MRVEKFLWYMTFLFAFFGSAFAAVNIGPFTLFPYRIFLVALLLIFIAQALMRGEVKAPRIDLRSHLQFFLFWLMYAILSLAWSASKGDAIREIVLLLMGILLIWFAMYYSDRPEDVERLFSLWFLALCILVALGFWEHVTGQHLPNSLYFGETRTDRMFQPTGVFHNPNDYATFLTLSLPFTLGVARYTRNKTMGIFAFGIALAVFYLVISTGSRANMIASLVQLGLWVAFLTSFSRKVKLAFVGTVVLIVMAVSFPEPIGDLFATVSSAIASLTTEAEVGDRSVRTRGSLIRNGIFFVYSTAGFGVGAGNAEFWMQNYPRYETGGITNVHNWWFELLTNYGVYVLAGYVVIYVSIIGRLWRSWRRAPFGRVKMIAESLLLSLIGFPVAVISPSSVMAFSPNWLLFAFALAFLQQQDLGVARSETDIKGADH